MASGDTLLIFTPLNGEPPDTNYATLDTRAGAANQQFLVLDFDDTTDESMDFRGVMPRHYDSGGITVTFYWSATSATSNTVSVDIAFKSVTDDLDDLDTKAYATANNSGAVTAPTLSGEVGEDEIAFTDGADMDSVAAGELFFMRFTRDADGTTATDNMTGDLELHAIEIRET